MLSLPFFIFAGSCLARITKTTKTRSYRFSKKNPKAFKQVTIYDLGNVEQQTRISFKKENLLKSDLEISKELNPELFTVKCGDNKLAYYFNSDKGFIYDMNGFFSGKFDKYDLKRLFTEIGTFLRSKNSPFSRNILRYRKRNLKGRFEESKK